MPKDDGGDLLFAMVVLGTETFANMLAQTLQKLHEFKPGESVQVRVVAEIVLDMALTISQWELSTVRPFIFNKQTETTFVEGSFFLKRVFVAGSRCR